MRHKKLLVVLLVVFVTFASISLFAAGQKETETL